MAGFTLFFFSNTDPKTQTVSGMLLSIVCQLCQQLVHISPSIIEIYKQNISRPTKKYSWSVLWILSETFRTIYIALDALDTLSKEEKDSLIQTLAEVSEELTLKKVNILVTSHVEPAVLGHLERL